MTAPSAKSSLAASLLALLLGLIAAGLVRWGDWTPWHAMAVVGAGGLILALIGIGGVLLIVGNRDDRARLWKVFVDAARADLDPLLSLWRLLRRRKR
jgi:hypothetical protein